VPAVASGIMSKSRISAKFSEDVCNDLMDRIDGTQAGIQNATAQIVFWKRHADSVVQCWQQVFQRADMEKRMNLIYLANDVVQTGRKTGREFSEAFHKALPEAFRHMMKHSDEPAQRKLKKLVHVWKDRQVWGNKAISLYLSMVRGVASDDGQVQLSSAPSTVSALPDPFSRLVQVLSEAHSSMLEVYRMSKVEAHAQEELESAVQQVCPCSRGAICTERCTSGQAKAAGISTRSVLG
jgi:CID domain